MSIFALISIQSLALPLQLGFYGLMGLGLFQLFRKEFLEHRRLALSARPIRKNLITVFLIAWGTWILASLIQRGLSIWAEESLSTLLLEPLAQSYFLTSLGFHGAVLMVALLCYCTSYQWPVLKQTISSSPLRTGLWAYVMSLPLIWLFSYFWTGLIKFSAYLGFRIIAPPQPLVDFLMENQNNWLTAAFAFLIIIVAPLSEECIFRAGLYRVTKAYLPQKMAAILTALAFALVHFNILAFLPLFLLGLLLGRAYEETGCLRTPFIFHAAFNAHNFLWILIDPASVQTLG